MIKVSLSNLYHVLYYPSGYSFFSIRFTFYRQNIELCHTFRHTILKNSDSFLYHSSYSTFILDNTCKCTNESQYNIDNDQMRCLCMFFNHQNPSHNQQQQRQYGWEYTIQKSLYSYILYYGDIYTQCHKAGTNRARYNQTKDRECLLYPFRIFPQKHIDRFNS